MTERSNTDAVPGASPSAPNIDHGGSNRRLWWAILLVLAGGLAFLAWGYDWSDDPELAGPAGSEGTRRRIPGLGETLVRVVDDAGRSREHCLLLAENDHQRTQGLRGITDLQGHRGMLFRFQQETTGPFNMRGTPLPLSIAFFNETGRFLTSADMKPCPASGEGCLLYEPTVPYWSAVEVPRGRLESMGIRRGSRIQIRGPCPR